MRWDRLFDDLQAQLDSDGQRELDLEVSDRTRRERAQVGLHERFIAHRGLGVELRLAAGVLVSGTVADAGSDWLLIDDPGNRPGRGHREAVRSGLCPARAQSRPIGGVTDRYRRLGDNGHDRCGGRGRLGPQ